MTSISRRLAALTLMLALINMTACAPGTPVKTLEGIITAAEVLLPFIAGPAGIPPILQGIIQSYLQAAYTATGQTATILADVTKTVAQRVTEVVALWAAVAKPNLPAGTPANIVNAVDAVAQAISNFLGSIQTPATSTTARAQIKNIKLNSADKVKLEEIKAKADEKLTQVKAARKP